MTAALSVIIVTWNSADTIVDCLASLQASTGLGQVETILVDNASSDDTCGIVARDFPAVRLIRNQVNAGFARANNMAIAASSADLVLLLNPDVILTDPAALSSLVGALAADPAIGIAGGRLVFPDGRHQVGDAGFRPSHASMVVHGLGLAHLLAGRHGLYLVRPDRARSAMVDVDWICGACLLVRRAAIQAAGALDETLFLYAEDVEFGCRIRAHGWRVVYLPGVSIVHLQGVSEAQASTEPARVSTTWLTSLLDLHVRLNGPAQHAAVRVAFAAGFGARALAYDGLAMVRRGGRARYRRRAAALRVYAGAAWRHVTR